MTAEIALLNRRAIAFAADSAVTISGAGPDKIYNSAEKVFEFSRLMPIGLMLYNTLEFVGIPIDVLVRRFRSENDKTFCTCKQACEEFLAYLASFKRADEDEDAHFESVIFPEFCEIKKEVYKRSNKEIFDAVTKAGSSFDLDEFHENVASEIIGLHEDTHSKKPLDGFLADVKIEDFRSRFLKVIVDCAKHQGGVFTNDKVLNRLVSLSFAIVKSNIFSESLSGIVIGGFGTEDLFPSLHAVEIDGVYFGKLKFKVIRDIDIDRRGVRAAIVPFAQSEMVERFLFGIDDDLEGKLLKYIEKSAERAVVKVKTATGIDAAAHGLSAASYAADVEKLLDRLKRKSNSETLDMVDFMPKQELAYTAEAFITLTSIKRRVSAQQETVGGPIDVAVVTKNEGFVWIKRKHYFDKELNSGYVVRTFRGDLAGRREDGGGK